MAIFSIPIAVVHQQFLIHLFCKSWSEGVFIIIGV